jgi:hypothetical protein
LDKGELRPMKITVDVDCMMTELERYSPEALFKAWLPIAGMNAEWLQDLMKRGSR